LRIRLPTLGQVTGACVDECGLSPAVPIRRWRRRLLTVAFLVLGAGAGAVAVADAASAAQDPALDVQSSAWSPHRVATPQGAWTGSQDITAALQPGRWDKSSVLADPPEILTDGEVPLVEAAPLPAAAGDGEPGSDGLVPTAAGAPEPMSPVAGAEPEDPEPLPVPGTDPAVPAGPEAPSAPGDGASAADPVVVPVPELPATSSGDPLGPAGAGTEPAGPTETQIGAGAHGPGTGPCRTSGSQVTVVDAAQDCPAPGPLDPFAPTGLTAPLLAQLLPPATGDGPSGCSDPASAGPGTDAMADGGTGPAGSSGARSPTRAHGSTGSAAAAQDEHAAGPGEPVTPAEGQPPISPAPFPPTSPALPAAPAPVAPSTSAGQHSGQDVVDGGLVCLGHGPGAAGHPTGSPGTVVADSSRPVVGRADSPGTRPG
jgi:hypothetical protein